MPDRCFFYGGNIAGAVFGCLLAGFYLLRVHDMTTAVYVAFALNVTVAAIALTLAATPARYEVRADSATKGSAGRAAHAGAVYLAIALSGMSALGAEVVWTRLLSLMLGGTVYTFSLILAVFLIGLGIGSTLGAFLARGAASPRVALGACQWLLTQPPHLPSHFPVFSAVKLVFQSLYSGGNHQLQVLTGCMTCGDTPRRRYSSRCSGSGVIPLRMRRNFPPSVGRMIVPTSWFARVWRAVAHEVCTPWFNNVVSIATSK